MLEATLALLRVGAHVLGDVDGVSPVLEGDPDGLADDVAAPDCEARPERREGAPQVLKRVEQEGDPVRCAEAPRQPLVEHEERHHTPGRAAACASAG